jgi:quinoprotein glucose dehydrogenase
MIALNAKTGVMINGFGTGGVVDLKQGVQHGNRQPIDPETGEIGLHATPAIANDVVVVGSSFREGQTVRRTTTPRGWSEATTSAAGNCSGRS